MTIRSIHRMSRPGWGDKVTPPRREMIRDLLILVSLLVPLYVMSVGLFLLGFLLIPTVPTAAVRLEEYTALSQAVTHVQDLVLIVLPGSVLGGSVARLRGVRLTCAIRMVCALSGVYWASLLALYITGILTGAFVLPFL